MLYERTGRLAILLVFQNLIGFSTIMANSSKDEDAKLRAYVQLTWPPSRRMEIRHFHVN